MINYACVNLKQIPADMVVNAMLVAMVSHATQPCDDSIYHVGSSVGNPVRYESLRDYSFRYFTAKPCYDKEGKAIRVGKVTVLENMNSFQRYMYIRYLLPLKVIQFLIHNYFYFSIHVTLDFYYNYVQKLTHNYWWFVDKWKLVL